MVVLTVLVTANGADAQRRYLPDPADEDWAFLRDAPRTDFWDPLKYLALGREDWFVTLSGQVRYRAEGFRVRPGEDQASRSDHYLLQRYLFGGDVRLGRRARIFAELQSGIINGRLRSPRPTDRNPLDLHQAFFEWRQAAGAGHVSIKAGRQELTIGSSRLISASPGLNVKRSFDGAAVAYRQTSWSLAVAAARLVDLRGGTFDDRPDWGQLFWGAAASTRSLVLARGEIGAYYLGIERRLSRYAAGLAAERRHTVGARWARTGDRLTLNYDALYQWGTFGTGRIRAWAFATESGYRLLSTGWQPRVSLRADVASGDAAPGDGRLESFNPLFPGNAYSGAVGLLGPTNLTDVTPAITFAPRRTVTVGLEAPSYWRTSGADGVYATDLRLLIPPGAGAGGYVGTNPGVLVAWQATPHLQFQGVITRFLPGGFLERTFVAPGFGFYSTSVAYRF